MCDDYSAVIGLDDVIGSAHQEGGGIQVELFDGKAWLSPLAIRELARLADAYELEVEA